VELASGKVIYKEKLPAAGGIASPFVTADGVLYFTSSLKSQVVKCGPKFEILATNEIGDSGSGWQGPYPFSSAAVSDGKIFILGEEKLWCIGKR
jgi:hypothetical protein